MSPGAPADPAPALPVAATGLPGESGTQQHLEAALSSQRKAYLLHPVPGYSERLSDLRTLQRFLRENREALIEAVNADYGCRSRHETLFAEIVPTIHGIAHTIDNLREWMKPQRRGVDPLLFPGARNRVVPQPLGVIGMIVPWNFPIFLSLGPLTGILAAGNRAMIKLSENSRHLARFLLERLPAYFPPDKVAVFDETGGVGIAFSRLPFDHLLFTGSTQTGRSVMAAAAANLCPVTLELGGKSPAVICPDFPLRTAAERILFVKLLNAGQSCTSVDYLWVPRQRVDEFVSMAGEIVARRYPNLATPDYTSIIDERAFNRLTDALSEAAARGSKLVPLMPGATSDPTTRKLAPHIVLNPPGDCELMQREIFGPILPILAYDRLEEVIEYINARPRPLALYPFSRRGATVQVLLERVMSGGVSVNDGLYHVAQHDLPFGGVGASGMGHYHGREGFYTFSKLRPVFYQAPVSGMRLLWPPYGALAERILRFFAR